MGKHIPLPLLTVYSVLALSKDPAPMWGTYWFIYPYSRQAIFIGYSITKGGTESCIARLLLTFHLVPNLIYMSDI